MEDFTAVDATLDYGYSTGGTPESLLWVVAAIALLILFQKWLQTRVIKER